MTDDRRYYMDYTGCGNTLNMTHPRTLQLIMDSLRYWVLEMHVDGFRFDLASALARELHDVDRLGAFFDIIQQDPVISQVKLIAEPWDLGEGGYQVGNFPAAVGGVERAATATPCARFWKGDEGQAGAISATGLTGSSDLYGRAAGGPTPSINFVTAHDGFTLHDLVSYNDKHNEANGEDNRDGTDHNLSGTAAPRGRPTTRPSWPCASGRSGTSWPTLLLSQGVPMLLAGDEIGRTQRGNNNAYCQDNEQSWHGWTSTGRSAPCSRFTRALIALRKRPSRSSAGGSSSTAASIRGSEVKDLSWFRPDGKEMTDDDWTTCSRAASACGWPGTPSADVDADGPAGRRRHAPAPHQRPLGADRLRPARPSAQRALGARPRHAGIRRPTAAARVSGWADLPAGRAFPGPPSPEPDEPLDAAQPPR